MLVFFDIICVVNFMTKVIVVGGGASGLVAAITAARKNFEVTILERNDSLGKKILVTGNGKCNYWNEDQSLKHYHSSNEAFIEQIITQENQEKVLKFFEKLGIVPKIKSGYYYPYSNQAVSVKAALVNEIDSLNINVVLNCYVEKIEKDNDGFNVYTNDQKYTSDAVILAVGSKAAPKTGSDGNGYDLVRNLGHSIIPVLPSLTQLYGSESYYKNWNGIRLDAKLNLYENDEKIATESGELHLTDYGISGICTFNLSGYVSKGLNENKKEYIKINFVSFLNVSNVDEFVSWLDNRNNILKDRTIDQLFDGFIHYKLVFLFLKLARINNDSYWDDLDYNKKREFASLFIDYKFEVVKTSDFDRAQVCSGGVSLEEINLKTMESLKVKNLYITGELIDIDGDCGGYNLGFAWISGMLAGEHVGVEND